MRRHMHITLELRTKNVCGLGYLYYIANAAVNDDRRHKKFGCCRAENPKWNAVARILVWKFPDAVCNNDRVRVGRKDALL